MTLSLTDLSPSSNVTVARSHVASAQALLTQGDQTQNDADAIDMYRRSSGQSEIAALTTQTVAEVIADSNPAAAGLAAAVTNEAQSATASVSDAGQATDRTTARTAAAMGLRAATLAIGYVTQALALPRPTSRVTIGFVGLGIVVSSAVLTYVLHRRATRRLRTV